MNNKKVKQMMFSVGALDVSKMIDIYTTNATRSLMSGRGLRYSREGMIPMVKAIESVHRNAVKRGWLVREVCFYD